MSEEKTMPGLQSDRSVRGSANEKMAALVLDEIASLVHVPREEDYGVDFYGHLREHIPGKGFTVTDSFALQVKGRDGDLVYGDVEHGTWKSYQIDWLKSLAVPLYLARVDRTAQAVDIHSLALVWQALRMTPTPFQIHCVSLPATPTRGVAPYNAEAVQHEAVAEGAGHGDGLRWTVRLGPPFLRLSYQALQDEGFRSSVVRQFRRWMMYDRDSLVRFHLGVSVHEYVSHWLTNGFHINWEPGRAMFWNPTPGANLKELARTVRPAIVSLGAHLQWQDDADAYRLIAVLEWLKKMGELDGMGDGLLDGLRKTRDAGISPKPSQSEFESRGADDGTY